MKFKEFITRQRVAIFIVGLGAFFVLLYIAHFIGYLSLWGELLIDLGASSMTIIFTALIIDYLQLKEASIKTQNAAGLAEDEIKATCFRVKWRMARLFGLERRDSGRQDISNQKEAIEYLDEVTSEVDNYLSNHNFLDTNTTVNTNVFSQYLERLQVAQTELEQALILYEYATSYSFREAVLALRRELQTAERVLGFIDTSLPFSKANLSMIRITARSIYQAITALLEHDSRSNQGATIHDKEHSLV